MKRRLNFLIVAVVGMLIGISGVLIRGQKPTVLAAASAPAPSVPVVQIRVQTLTPAAPTPDIQAPATVAPASVPVQPSQNKVVAQSADEKTGYTAVQGDTLSDVATGLLGRDNKKNRDAVVAANPSLQDNPDRVLDGKTYNLVPPVAAASPAPTPKPQPERAAVPEPEATVTANPKSDRILKYTAQPGDSVSVLAAGLLGADSKTNRDAIINENKSLQRDPDKLIAGNAYKIPADKGLTAAPAPAATSAAPTTQPDADEVVKAADGRELRYTARTGDTVSKLAEVLLGSDTPENRDAIINNNVSLKSDPDLVVAGKTYWIPAPVAAVQQP